MIGISRGWLLETWLSLTNEKSGWGSGHLNLTLRVFSRHSGFLPPKNSTPIWRVCLSMVIRFPPTTAPLTKYQNLYFSMVINIGEC